MFRVKQVSKKQLNATYGKEYDQRENQKQTGQPEGDQHSHIGIMKIFARRFRGKINGHCFTRDERRCAGEQN